ncbi:Prokaryotic chromosome segregation and condensation protein ScpB [mine drainage metagenome]|jgi:hypothetical protein|uniref:Segregation and condensation protein B n=2 Tax=root TaxID=1 RepID=A0A149VZH1_9PROT|nr:SMC-Scp complex subunit ScpB [Ferrovum myxofaciens]KXW58596.1 hypothetical protein FEMY_09950 [Ferrovum myxofaciens]MBW8028254.1 hypothetical protein [Ferrovum sp.]NDU90517.1 SMC-Scp complex subunit ScpB [Ferrovum sp.]
MNQEVVAFEYPEARVKGAFFSAWPKDLYIPPEALEIFLEQFEGPLDLSSSPILKTLEERGWIEAVGQRETPGRPTLFGTTRNFLDHLGLRTLRDLPALDGHTEGNENGTPALT